MSGVGISDLKNDGNEERFIPHAEETSQSINVMGEPTKVVNNGPVLGNVPPKRKGSVMMSMSSGMETGTREKADFSSLPKSKNESLGVDVKESITAEIFKPGGDFDKYIKEKIQRDAFCLPSTSPANAAWSLDKLIDAWSQIKL